MIHFTPNVRRVVFILETEQKDRVDLFSSNARRLLETNGVERKRNFRGKTPSIPKPGVPETNRSDHEGICHLIFIHRSRGKYYRYCQPGSEMVFL